MTFKTQVWHPNSEFLLPGGLALALYLRQSAHTLDDGVSGLEFLGFHYSAISSLTCYFAHDPAVEPDGKVCISILHKPGIDEFNEYESADERWRPIIGIEQVLVSVMAMLGDPNINSPANVDAAVSCVSSQQGLYYV